jgi:hypothetical protein
MGLAVQESGAEVRRLTEEKADLQAELGRLVNQRDEIKSLRYEPYPVNATYCPLYVYMDSCGPFEGYDQ